MLHSGSASGNTMLKPSTGMARVGENMKFLEIAYVRMEPKVIVIGWNGDGSFGEVKLYKDDKGVFHIESEDQTEEFFVQLFRELHKWTREQEERWEREKREKFYKKGGTK